jgi:hypothetical protein
MLLKESIMSFDLTTPAVLFSAVSLLLLAYTNRFLVTANRIRELCLKARAIPNPMPICACCWNK